MIKALIVYASFTGTTERIANLLAQDFRDLKVDVEVRKCTEAYPQEFQNYDICVVATYTYGSDGALPEEAEDFYFDLKDVNLKGKIFGVLGSGDRIYEKFCPAVDDFDKQFEATQAIRGTNPLKINLSPDGADKEAIKHFAQEMVSSLPSVRKN